LRENNCDNTMTALKKKFHCLYSYPWNAKQSEIKKLKKTFPHMGVRVITEIEDWDKIAAHPERVIIVIKTIRIINIFGLNNGFERLMHDNHVYFFFCNGEIKGKTKKVVNVDISNWTEFVCMPFVEKKYFKSKEPPQPHNKPDGHLQKQVERIPGYPEKKTTWNVLCDFFCTALSVTVAVLNRKTIKITIFIGLGGIAICLAYNLIKNTKKDHVIAYVISLAATITPLVIAAIHSKISKSKTAVE